MRTAGVNLDDSYIRISVVDKTFGVIKPAASEEIKLSGNEQERLGLIKESLSRLKEKYNFDGIVIGLGLGFFSHYFIDMPLLGKNDMRSALTFELEKYMPLPPDEYYFDFSVIEKTKDKAKVLVFAVRRDRIGGLLGDIRESGINILGVRCSFIEAVNEFLSAGKVRDSVFAYGDEEEYNAVVLRGRVPVMFRIISKGENALSEFQRLAESSSGDIYMSGSVEPLLTEKLNIKTFPSSLSHAVALSVLKKPGIILDFIPASLISGKKDYYPYSLGALTALAVLIFFLTEIFSYYKDYSALKKVEKKIETIKGKASGVLDSRKKMEIFYDKEKFLSDFKNRSSVNIKVLAELSRVLPKDTWLTVMSVDEKGKVEIEGFSKRAANVIEPLIKSKFFTRVEFASPIVTQNNEEKFTIRMELAG